MKHPRRAAAIVTSVAGVVAVSACVVVGQVAETSTPGSTAVPALAPAVAQATASPSAEFVVPLYVPAPPTGVLGPGDGSDVLTPGNVIPPSPTPTAPPRAVIRPA
ncbi:hypothetical protein [Kineococcus radiotolerans]|uniref:hypothetical protein n=1 Tax=Kineococcus radiotolerans TaxID=131568 RepID=UPI00003A3C4E|nr:hypothetical protein [Kineococcus radiotolerans]